MSNVPKHGDELVPGYKLVRRLGAGSSGEVWVARASGGVTVAIKIVSNLQSVVSTRELIALRVVHRVKHPNLCPIFGVWFLDRSGRLLSTEDTDAILEDESQRYETIYKDSTIDLPIGELDPAKNQAVPAQMVIAMGLGDCTLFDRMNEVRFENGLSKCGETEACEPGGIDSKELLAYLTAAASAIDELNLKHKIFHCDLKPQNILLVGGQAQVCDFGLARQVFNVRMTSIAFGTPAYGAPEMLFERTYSKTLDQYSLAVTYYHLRTARLPFQTLTHSAILRDKASGHLDLSFVPERERAVLEKATLINADNRYASCQAFVTALGQSLGDAPLGRPNRGSRAERSGTGRSQRSLAKVFAILATLAILIGGAFVWQTILRKGPLSKMRLPDASVDVVPEIEITELEPEITEPEILEPEPTQIEPMEPEPMEPEPIQPEPTQPEPTQPVPTQPEPEPPAPVDLKKEIASLIGDIEQIVARADSPDNKLARGFTDNLRSALELSRRLKSEADPNDRSLAGRIALAQLSIGTQLMETDRGAFPSQPVAMVRSLFAGDSYAHEPASFAAASALVASWQSLYRDPKWNERLADDDMLRAVRVAGDDAAKQSALNPDLGMYLTELLQRRYRQSDSHVYDASVAWVSRRMMGERPWSDIASASLWLVAEPSTLTLDPIPTRVPSSLPTSLRGTFLLGTGLNAFQRGDYRSSFQCWQSVATDVAMMRATAADDRHRVASLLLDWLIEASGVSDTDTSRVRYASNVDSASGVLDVISELGKGERQINSKLRQENFLFAIASEDYVSAAKLLRDFEITGGKIETSSPQFGRAVFDLSNLAILTGTLNTTSEEFTSWPARLILGCLAQSPPEPFPVDGTKQKSVEPDGQLFSRCFRPAMVAFKPANWKFPLDRASLPIGLDEAFAARFCETFVSLGSDRLSRRSYDTVTDWLDDVEFAAAFAGSRSGERNRRSELFREAAISHLRNYYEGQSNSPPSVVLARLERYRGEAKRLGSTPRCVMIDGLIANERANSLTDLSSSASAFDESIAALDSLIDFDGPAPTDSDLAMALNYRARAVADKASMLEFGDASPLFDKSLADARRAVGIAADTAVREESLAILGKACILSAHRGYKVDLNNAFNLIDEAVRSIDEAIAMRRSDSLDYTNLALLKLQAIWVDTLVSLGDPRFTQAERAARDWMNEISAGSTETPPSLTIRADSYRIRCDWHFKAAGISDQTGGRPLAMAHVQRGFDLATKNIEPTNPIAHLVTLAYVDMRGRELERTLSKPLLLELRRALKQIESPSPRIRVQQDRYLNLLEKMESYVR